jgi:short-subunit dehydrogenase
MFAKKERTKSKYSRNMALKVFITGASSGIGLALAQYYAAQGATLGLVARRSEKLKTLASTLSTHLLFYPLDVRDKDALKQAASDFMQKVGVPDIVIANAGVSAGTLTENKEDIATFQAIFEINVMGMVHTFSPFIEAMKNQSQGQLVGIASVAGIRGLPGAGAYSASKSAAMTYLESLRTELANRGIAVTTIAPGYIKTPMTDVNHYPMPFLMPAERAAKQFAKAIAAKKRFVVIPWQMGILARIMRLLPAFLWDFLMKNAPRKSHANWDWL